MDGRLMCLGRGGGRRGLDLGWDRLMWGSAGVWWRGHRYSGRVRVGATGAVGTVWTSDTAVVCVVGAGGDGSMAVAVSGGGRVGSLTEGTTYDVGAVSGMGVGNEGRTGGGSLSLVGADFGTSR